MKWTARTWVTTAVLGCVAPLTAHAYAPAVVYIPSDDVTLVPTALCAVAQGGQVNSGLGCGGVTAESTTSPYTGDLDALVAGVQSALQPYDVYVTTERPPPYLPYVMIMPSDVEALASQSFTCTATGISCASLKRNAIAFTTGSTQNCSDPNVLHAVLYAIGRASGLEGSSDPTDPMGYVPDYSAPATAYQDVCSPIANQLGFNDQDEQIVLPLECTSLDHTGCLAVGEQNSHLDLLEFYGPRVVDTDAPVLNNIEPADGSVIAGGVFTLDVDIGDADSHVGVRWTVQSDALRVLGQEDGVLSRCTNNACATPGGTSPFNWNPAVFKPTDSDWSLALDGVPPGLYAITLEVSDFHGNASTASLEVCVPGGEEACEESGTGTSESDGGLDATAGPADTGADASDGGDTSADNTGVATLTTAADGTSPPPSDTGGDTDTDSVGQVADPLGCSCGPSGQRDLPILLIGGIVLLGLVTRADRNPRTRCR